MFNDVLKQVGKHVGNVFLIGITFVGATLLMDFSRKSAQVEGEEVMRMARLGKYKITKK